MKSPCKLLRKQPVSKSHRIAASCLANISSTLISSSVASGTLTKLASGCLLLIISFQLPARGQSPSVEDSLTPLPIPTNPAVYNPPTFPPNTLSPAATAEKIGRLDDAILTITVDSDDESRDIRRKLKLLSRVAIAYGELGEQPKALKTLAQAEQIATENADTFYSYPSTVAEIASFYTKIGDTVAAQRLLEQAIALSHASSNPYAIGDIAEAYSLISPGDIAEAGLTSLVELIEEADSPLWEKRAPSVPTQLIEAYGRLENEATANRGLSRLLDAQAPSSLDALIAYSVAYNQQNNTDAAQKLLAEAMESIRNHREDDGKIFFDIGKVAYGYGYLGNAPVAEQALAELVQIADSTRLFEAMELSEEEELIASLRRMEYSLTSSSAIAISYSRLGNAAKAQESLAPLKERFKALAETDLLASALLYLGPLVQAYGEIDDIPEQEAVLQIMFDAVPKLQELASYGITISDVTPGYLGITAIVEGYIATDDDAIAKERLQTLEAFFKTIRFAEGGFSAQLNTLAAAAIRRGDDATAQRLLDDARQLIGTPEDQFLPDDPRFNVLGGIEQVQIMKVLRHMIWNYNNIKDEQVRQAGLEASQQLAAKLLGPELKSEIDNAIVRAYAGL